MDIQIEININKENNMFIEWIANYKNKPYNGYWQNFSKKLTEKEIETILSFLESQTIDLRSE